MKAKPDASGARRQAWPAPLAGAMLSDARLGESGPDIFNPVSYTHLTLPTSDLV